MLKVGYRYVYEDVDRHGNVRLYVWRGKGHRKVRLKSRLNSPDFDSEYRAALAANTAPSSKASNDPTKLPVPDTYRHLCTAYMASAEFARLSPRTQRVRRGIDGRRGHQPLLHAVWFALRTLRAERSLRRRALVPAGAEQDQAKKRLQQSHELA